MKLKILQYLVFINLFFPLSYAQNVGIGTTTPATPLDVVGTIRTDSGLVVSPNSVPAGANISANALHSSIRVTDEGATAANLFTLTGSPKAGQMLYLVNEDADTVTFDGNTIAPNAAGLFFYNGSNWFFLNEGQPDTDWTRAGDSVFTDAFVGIGTTAPPEPFSVSVGQTVNVTDQEQTSQDGNISINPGQELRQSIVAGSDYTVLEITFNISRPLLGGAGTAVVDVYNGDVASGGTPLTSSDPVNIDALMLERTFTFSTPPTLTNGQTYTLAIRNANATQDLNIQSNSVGGYANGTYYDVSGVDQAPADLKFSVSFDQLVYPFQVQSTGNVLVDGNLRVENNLNVQSSANVQGLFTGVTGGLFTGPVSFSPLAGNTAIQMTGAMLLSQFGDGPSGEGNFYREDGNLFYNNAFGPQALVSNETPAWTKTNNGLLANTSPIGINTATPQGLFDIATLGVGSALDQSQTTSGGTGTTPIHQSFQPGTNGLLTQIDLELSTTADDYYVVFYKGDTIPGATPIGSSDLLSLPNSFPLVVRSFTFSKPIPLEAGATYSFKLLSANLSFPLSGFSNANPYANGAQITNSRDKSASNDLYFETYMQNSGSGLTVTSTGDVGIGTTTPASKLEVCGDTRIVGQISANSSNLTSGLTCSSDRRLKTNIAPIDNPIKVIGALTGVRYNWRTTEFPNHGYTSDLQHGLIAQDVEAVVPSLVVTQSDGYKSVNYIAVIPFLIEAIKDQQLQINTLQQENSDLKKQVQRINQLEANVEVLKSLLGEQATR